ncbi:MAG: S-layer homology domain-containing protein [Clostridia bacterium]|nr:S-layer homology domain-containing protein [Clostridia bacterium]
MRKKAHTILLTLALTIFCTVFAALLPVSADDSISAVKPFAKHGSVGAEIVFSEEDLTENTIGKHQPTGLLITAVHSLGGAFWLDGSPLSDGTIISRTQFSALSFRPEAEQAEGTLDFLPLFASGSTETSGSASRITVRSGDTRNFAPTAADLTLSGYRDIDLPIALSAFDHEGDPLTYTVVSAPAKGTLSVVDGQLIYSPAGKTGEVCFSYYAADNAGNTSDLATVTIAVGKRDTDVFYSDLLNSPLQHAAVSLAEAGVYRGRSVGGDMLFDADETIDRGEFIALAAAALELPLGTPAGAALTEACGWQSAYIAAAAEADIVSDTRYGDDVTVAEAAAILSRMLDAEPVVGVPNAAVPAWAATDVSTLTALGVFRAVSDGTLPLTRGEAAVLLANAIAVRTGDRLGWHTCE